MQVTRTKESGYRRIQVPVARIASPDLRVWPFFFSFFVRPVRFALVLPKYPNKFPGVPVKLSSPDDLRQVPKSTPPPPPVTARINMYNPPTSRIIVFSQSETTPAKGILYGGDNIIADGRNRCDGKSPRRVFVLVRDVIYTRTREISKCVTLSEYVATTASGVASTYSKLQYSTVSPRFVFRG